MDHQGCPIAGEIYGPEELRRIAAGVKAGVTVDEERAAKSVALAVWGQAGRLAKGRLAYFREDLFIVGLRAAIEAFKRWDPNHDKGALPSTYAFARSWGLMLNAWKAERKTVMRMCPLDEDTAPSENSRFKQIHRADNRVDEIDASIEVRERMELASLTRTELAVIRYRFGLNGLEPVSCRAMKKFVKLSPWGVVLNERKALAKLRDTAACA